MNLNTDLEAQRILDELRRRRYDELSPADRTLIAVWLFEAEVANGGFRHYFWSAGGDTASHAPAALREIGAAQLAEIAATANAVFGPAGPPAESKARREMVEAMDPSADEAWEALEAKYFECSEDVDELLDGYINRDRP